MNNQQRIEIMISRLKKELQPSRLEIIDDSYLHAGHEGSKSGKGHFTVIICSKKFDNLPLLKRHQLVYQALAEMMQTDIHALVIKAK